MPRTPSRSTRHTTARLGCRRAGGVLGAPPKARLARSTPMAIVSTTMPSSKPKSAMPMLGPCSESGPSEIGPPAVAAAGRRRVDRERLVWRPFALPACQPADWSCRANVDGHDAGGWKSRSRRRELVLEEVAVGADRRGVGAVPEMSSGTPPTRSVGQAAAVSVPSSRSGMPEPLRLERARSPLNWPCSARCRRGAVGDVDVASRSARPAVTFAPLPGLARAAVGAGFWVGLARRKKISPRHCWRRRCRSLPVLSRNRRKYELGLTGSGRRDRAGDGVAPGVGLARHVGRHTSAPRSDAADRGARNSGIGVGDRSRAVIGRAVDGVEDDVEWRRAGDRQGGRRRGGRAAEVRREVGGQEEQRRLPVPTPAAGRRGRRREAWKPLTLNTGAGSR